MRNDVTRLFNVQIICTDNIIRSQNLESDLTALGLSIQVAPGIVPERINYESGLLHSPFISSLVCQRKISIGEVGCALAHISALKNFLKGDHRFSFIFEDDAEVVAEFDFEIVVKLLDSDIPVIIALGWIPGFAIAKKQKVPLNHELIELITSPTCTFAYAINRPAAKVITESGEKIIDVADWPIYSLNKVKFYATHSPWVTANHDPKFSTIGERSKPISKSAFKVLVGRIKLTSSFVALTLLSITNQLNVSPQQIVHRLLIRDMMYNYGTGQVNNESTINKVIPFPLKFQKLLHLLKLT